MISVATDNMMYTTVPCICNMFTKAMNNSAGCFFARQFHMQSELTGKVASAFSNQWQQCRIVKIEDVAIWRLYQLVQPIIGTLYFGV